VDIWDDTGDSIVEHVAGVDDFEVAEATYRAAVARWPAARITLRQLVGGGADGSASYSFVVFCSSTQAARSREA
jgi:hypothetical protein